MRVADGLMQETPKSLILLRFTTEPRTGRFITRDSYRGERENADTWHLYAYCANNPINYVDPSGYKRVKQYSTAKTFNYKVYLGLGRLFITIVVKWDVKGKKKTLCTAYISRKIKTGVGVIEKITKNKIKITNAKQRAYVRYHVTPVSYTHLDVYKRQAVHR